MSLKQKAEGLLMHLRPKNVALGLGASLFIQSGSPPTKSIFV